MIEWYSVEGETPLTEGDIKELFNKTIYGGGHLKWCDYITHENLSQKEIMKMLRKGKQPKEMRNKSKPHPFYLRFLKDTQQITQLVWNANEELRQKICAGMPDDSDQEFSRCRNKLMSQFCGILENEITFRAYKYRVENGLCSAKRVDWGYDGFTTPPPPAHTDHEFHLGAMNDYVRQKTGFQGVCFVEKALKPDTIIQSVIDERRVLVVAEVAEMVVVGEAIAAPPEPSNEDEEYLVWKENFEKEWCKIKNTACFMRTCHTATGVFEKFVLHTEKQLVSAYKHESYNKASENGKSKKVCFVKEWLEDPNMLCYDDAEVYPPPLVCPPNKFNLWRPFDQDDDMNPDHPDYDAEGVRMWCEHLKTLCNHEQPVYEYVSCWVAHSIQKPAEKPECMITFVSDEGIGKNIFTTSLSDIYGAGKKLETPCPERECWGSFNTPMASAYLVVLSETDKRNTAGADGKIKALITDPTLVINPKGKDQYGVVSYHRLITNSNTADPHKTHKGDRRNLIIRCSDEKKEDWGYFSTLSNRLKQRNTLRSIYACLKATDLSEWSFRNIPRTIYHETIIEGNRPALECFLENFTIKNRDTPYMDLYGTQMLQHFRKWKEDTGYSFDEKISEGVLVKRLLTELKLPADAITKLGRGSKGIKRRYDIVKLKQRFQIGCGLQPYSANGTGGLVENEVLERGEDVESEDEGEDEDEGVGF